MIKINASARLKQVRASVAHTILQQLGGNKFIAMTGAKSFMTTSNGMHFSIAKGATNKANKVVIELAGNDTYTIKFYNQRGINLKDVGTVEGVHAADLASTFTKHTGLDTRL